MNIPDEIVATSCEGIEDPEHTCDEPVENGWCVRPRGHSGFCDDSFAEDDADIANDMIGRAA